MIKGIIFDLDGTLLNTTEDITNSLNRALEEYELPKLELSQVMLNLGNGSESLIRASVPKETSEEKIKEVKAYYDNYYKIHNNILTRPYEGILDLILELKREGYLLAITSNKYQEGVTELNAKTFFNLFDVALGETKGIPLKPNPDIIHIALSKMKLAQDEVLYVGDTEVDHATAVNANLKSVLVTWGFRTKDSLQKLNPDYIIDKPQELLEILAKK